MLLAQGYCWVDKRVGNERLEMHPDAYIVVADNTNGRGGNRRYQRQRQDSALINRFVFVRVDYDTAMEEALFGDDKAILRAVWDLREKAAKLALDEEVGLRAIKTAYRLRKAHGKDRYSVDVCLDAITAGWSDADRQKAGVTNTWEALDA